MKLRDAGDDKSGSFSEWLFSIRKWRVCGMTSLRWIAAGPKSNIVFSTTALRVCRCDTTLDIGVIAVGAFAPQGHKPEPAAICVCVRRPSSNDLIA